MAELVLHDYWRSSAAARLRIALAVKGLDYTSAPHNLRRRENRDPAYLALNPQGLIPALSIGSEILTQSLAILEWLEETHPVPPLLPADPLARARVRAMALVVACEIHPLQNVSPGRQLVTRFEADDAAVQSWNRHWITKGFDGLEPLLARHAGAYAYGDAPTLADCCLVPQAYNAERFGLALADWPTLARVVAHARTHPAFIAAAPENQPGAP